MPLIVTLDNSTIPSIRFVFYVMITVTPVQVPPSMNVPLVTQDGSRKILLLLESSPVTRLTPVPEEPIGTMVIVLLPALSELPMMSPLTSVSELPKVVVDKYQATV